MADKALYAIFCGISCRRCFRCNILSAKILPMRMGVSMYSSSSMSNDERSRRDKAKYLKELQQRFVENTKGALENSKFREDSKLDRQPGEEDISTVKLIFKRLWEVTKRDVNDIRNQFRISTGRKLVGRKKEDPRDKY